MKRRASMKDVFQLGDDLFIRDAVDHLSPEQLQYVRAGSISSVGPYTDNAGSRALLSPEQLAQLARRGVDLAQPATNEDVRGVVLYIRELVDVIGVTEVGSEDDWLDATPVPEGARGEFLVVVVFADTGEVIAHWRPEEVDRARVHMDQRR